MSHLQNASLVLKSSNAICDANRLNMTWNNINLRTLLGDMYDKYDMFNLCLNTVTTASAPASTGGSNDDRNVIFYLSGLPFVNQTYDVQYNTNTSKTALCSFQFVSSACSTQYFYSNNIATFDKRQDMVNISLSYGKVLDGATPTTVNVFPHIVLIFDIFPVPKTNDVADHRMKISQ